MSPVKSSEPSIADSVPAGRYRLSILGASSPERTEVERFVCRAYAQHYGADLRHLLPNLFCLGEESRRVSAALGFRSALGAPLFLEHYLPGAVECVLSERIGRPCDRRGIVEVGNLAADSAGGTRALITALTGFLKGAGHDWAVFTAVTSLRNSFRRLGIELLTLGAARIECLPRAEQANWGQYYDSNPMVVATNVHHAYSALFPHATSPRSTEVSALLALGCGTGWDAAWIQAA